MIRSLQRVIYPSGRQVYYDYDSQGRLHRVRTRADSSAPLQTLLSEMQHLPFGPANDWQLGNGLQHFGYVG